MRLIFGASPFLLALLALGSSQPAEAKRAYGMAGCGLGSVVMGSTGGQISAATTNGTFYSQPLGITSGTLNCQTDEQLKQTAMQQNFLNINLLTLQKEMAQGSGSTLEAFVEVLGCNEKVQDQAVDKLVKAYQEIFQAPGVAGILDSAKEQLTRDQTLSAQCTNLG